MSHANSLFYYNPAVIKPTTTSLEVDVCIYGGNAGGVIAAVQASKMGLSAVVLEPGNAIGGMTASGLSCTDAGATAGIGGLSREFYQRCGSYYGAEIEWRFEPHIAEKVLWEMLGESGVPIHFYQFLNRVEMDGHRITAIELEGGLRVAAKAFIDCSYEGDLMAKAGVSYHVGRESNNVYGELYNGSQVMDRHQFYFPVDPYIVPGDPSSGLLPGIESGEAVDGVGDHRIQAYNFRLCLSSDPDNQVDFEKPENYDESEYELSVRYTQAGYAHPICKTGGSIRGNKIDMNNFGAVSSDFIGRNYAYPEGDYATREKIFQKHVTYHKGLMWFWRNDPRVPREHREYLAAWGLAADEFVRTGHWPHQLYVREARRMVSDYVMTEHHCLNKSYVEDPIGMASYTMDSHNTRRIVRDGRVLNEGNVEIVETQPFSISHKSIVPGRGECENLLVPVCMSASHICYGSIRMEPVFMILGQTAATIAAIAIENRSSVQDVTYDELRPQQEDQEQVLELDTSQVLETIY